MPFRFKKTPAYAGQSAKLSNLGLGGRLATPEIEIATPCPGGGSGTAADPYVMCTDGTPLLFTIDSSVSAEYRADDQVDTYYGKYVTFVCPTMNAGDTLRIRYGVQTDFVDYLDTYMIMFEGSTYSLGVNTYVDEDDDGGSGYYDEFENTLLEFAEGALTPGASYVIEATTFGNSDVGNVKMIIDVVSGGPILTAPTLPVSFGGAPPVSWEEAVALTGGAYGSLQYTPGDDVVIDYSDSVSREFRLGSTDEDGGTIFVGNTPCSLKDIVGIRYPSPATGIIDYIFDSTVTSPTYANYYEVIEINDTAVKVRINNKLVIQQGNSLTASSESLVPLTLSTTGFATAYSIVDSLSNPVASGNMPFDLRSLPDGDTYTVTAGIITFTVTMEALPTIPAANQVLRLDASDATSVTLSGADVTGWTDKSLAGNNATTIVASGGGYPTYTATDGGAVVFNAANLTGMSTNAFLGVAPSAAKTIFIVCSNMVETTRECFWTYGSGEGDILSRWVTTRALALVRPSSTGIFGVPMGNYIAAGYRTSPPVVAGYRNTPGPGTNPQTIRMYDDRYYATYPTGYGYSLSTTPSAYGLHLMRPLPSATVSPTVHQTGNVHEVIAYDVDLSDVDVATLVRYIKLKWGILPIYPDAL